MAVQIEVIKWCLTGGGNAFWQTSSADVNGRPSYDF